MICSMLMLAAAAMGSTSVMPGVKACPNMAEVGPNISLSFLIWQAKEEGLEFASKSFLESSGAASAEAFDEKLFAPDFAWRPGFKLEFGYNLPYDSWSLESRWTYYGGNFTSLKKHIDHTTSPEGVGVVPLFNFPFFSFDSGESNPLRYEHAAANLKLFFNGFDLELGRTMLPIKTLPTRLYLGVKAAWIRQFYHAEYSDGTEIITSPDDLMPLSSRMAFSSRVGAIGPRAGLDTKWNLGAGFSLLADAGLSILCSFFGLHTEYNQLSLDLTHESGVSQEMAMNEKFRELNPVIEGTLGIDWGVCFGKQKPVFLGMTFAYEMQYWWSQNHLRRNYAYNAPGNMWDMRGDLEMQGLTVSLRSTF